MISEITVIIKYAHIYNTEQQVSIATDSRCLIFLSLNISNRSNLAKNRTRAQS